MRVRASHLATVSVMALTFPLLGATAALAGTDNPKACFGQDRAAYVTANGGHGPTISQRAQSDSTNGEYPNLNVQLNKEYKASCS